MFVIVGVLVVLGAIVGGYLLEKGNLLVLLQPAELVIIGGAALGTILIANPVSTVMRLLKNLSAVLGGSKFTKAYYLDSLKMLNDLFGQARKGGIASLEAHIEDPGKSAIFAKYPAFAKNHHAVHFVCDTLRMAVTGGVEAMDLDQLMELDIDVHHREAHAPVNALSTMADSLPGLGIVAAVLGVVITMGAIGGPPEEIGHKVAAALVGTFLGILMCYGFFGPLASNMSRLTDAESEYYHCLRAGLYYFSKGAAPLIALEFARRAIPSELRPSFAELEGACKKSAQAAAPSA